MELTRATAASSYMALLNKVKHKTVDLLLPRFKEESRPPSPLLEPAALLSPPPPIITSLGDTSMRRSIVTHAVLGSEAAGLQSLPQELLFLIFCRLDTPTLCRLSCVSHSCESFAMDPLVWERTVGHSKETARRNHLHAMQLREEQLEAEAEAKRRRWRQWKRRAIGVIQAVCGVALILLPVLAVLSRRRDDGSGKAAPRIGGSNASAAAAAGGTKQLPLKASPSGQLQFEGVVWNAAASCARAA